PALTIPIIEHFLSYEQCHASAENRLRLPGLPETSRKRLRLLNEQLKLSIEIDRKKRLHSLFFFLTSHPLGGNGSFPWESLSLICPFGR
ncbi:hypothetical protein, partial [Klebsiella pneumoniae]